MRTWVLLRGLTRERRHWGAFVPALQQALPQARIVALDLPGNGALNGEPSPARIEAMAAFCRAELQRLGMAPPYALLGLSMGGMVAAAWAADWPEEVCAAVLLNSSLRPFSPFWWRLRPACWRTLVRLAFGPHDEHLREAAILHLTSRHPAPAGLLDDWAAWRRERPVSTLNALRQLRAAAHFRASANAPAVPLLLLASRGDALVDARCSQALAAAWACPLVMHPQAGHDLTLDDPVWVARQVHEWLDPRASDAGNTRLR